MALSAFCASSTGRSNLILGCEALSGNPSDSSLYKNMLDRVIGNYGITPRDSATDGGYASKENQECAQSAGVIRQNQGMIINI
jgi:IS5 family transposase